MKTRVYLLYSYPLKRIAIISASCKSMQSTMYSPALMPLGAGLVAGGHSLLDEFKLQPTVPKRRNNKGRSSHGGMDSDSGDDDDFGAYYAHENDSDDDENVDPNALSPRTDDDDNIPNTPRIGGDSSDSEDEFYLYGGGAVAASHASSVVEKQSILSHPSHLHHQQQHQTNPQFTTDITSVGAGSTGTYTNHVELVQNADGEIEIVPLILAPRQASLLQRQRESEAATTPGLHSQNHGKGVKTPDFHSAHRGSME